jgi:hypothetical protein
MAQSWDGMGWHGMAWSAMAWHGRRGTHLRPRMAVAKKMPSVRRPLRNSASSTRSAVILCIVICLVMPKAISRVIRGSITPRSAAEPLGGRHVGQLSLMTTGKEPKVTERRPESIAPAEERCEYERCE